MKRKYKILLHYVATPLVLLILAYSIYHRVVVQPHLSESWKQMLETFQSRWYVVLLIILLMLANWSFEALKWQALVRPVQKVGLGVAMKAVFSGLSVSMLIPNGLGEYLGRMLYLKKGNKLRSVAVSFVGSLAQILATFAFGLIGLFYFYCHFPENQGDAWLMRHTSLRLITFVASFLLIFFTLLYYNVAWLTKRFGRYSWVQKYRYVIEDIACFEMRVLTKVLLFAFARYIVFLLQYLLTFYALGIVLPILPLLMGVALMFLLIALVPTIPIAELGLRGEISTQIFSLITSNMLGIVSVTAFVWVVNLLMPAVIGLFFLLLFAYFKRKGDLSFLYICCQKVLKR